jgi:hypothetical protein
MAKIEDALNDCIERMAAGERLENCLASYPDLAEELKSLLPLPRAVTEATSDIKPRPEFRAVARYRFQSALAGKGKEKEKIGVAPHWRRKMKKTLFILATVALTVGLVLGLTTTVFAQEGELIGELAKNAKPYRGYAGKITSLEDAVLTLERRGKEGGWTVDIDLTEETKYRLPGAGEVTAQEFETYVTDALAAERTIRAVTKAGKAEDGTITAEAARIIPKLVAGKVTSVADAELILETKDSAVAIALTEETRYGIPGQGQVTATEFTEYFDEATADDKVVKTAVRVNEEDGTVTALGIKVLRANGPKKKVMRFIQRLRNRRVNRIVDGMGEAK